MYSNMSSYAESLMEEFPKPKLKKGEIDLGTTIMAVVFDGGVVIGADSRTSSGSYVANRVSDKLTPVHDLIYCCRSGSAADTEAIADIVRYYLNHVSAESRALPLVKTAGHVFRDFVYGNKDRLSASIIVAGWDPVGGGQIVEVKLGGTTIETKVAIGGSGSTFIFGLVDAEYRENMNKEETAGFVAKCISHAIARDGSSGGLVRLAIITEDGVERRVIPGNQLPFQP